MASPNPGSFRRLLFFGQILLVASTQLMSQQVELRGIWMTPRRGDEFWSKQEIAQAMERTREAGFNTVYFLAWSRGWPLWRSEFFQTETGYLTDPRAGDRDILQEAIEEAHARGLDIEAWMEYGFVGWWDGYQLEGYPKGPLFAKHPEWLARRSDGSDEFISGHVGTFYWMAHSQPAVQRFLVELHTEIARKYEVEGIELDRIRYPRLDCGYDSVTVSMYRASHQGAHPPAPDDSAWMRWRADRLLEFHKAAFASIKRERPGIIVSNAPGHYSTGAGYSAYEDYLPDWKGWIRGGSVDAVQVQMYVAPEEFRDVVRSMMRGIRVEDRFRLFAGLVVKPSEKLFSREQIRELVSISRGAGLDGYAFWFYNDIRDNGLLPFFRDEIHKMKAVSPFRSADFKKP